MALYFLTGSKHKFAEAKDVLPELEQLEADLPEIQELDAHKIITAKLREARTLHRGSALMVEDSSLTLSGMRGLPGPLIKWFVCSIGLDGLCMLAKTFGAQAVARTVVGYASEEGGIEFFEGEVHGTVVEPRGESDFGWDAVFTPEGSVKTYAEMSREEKNAVSHRGKALRAFKKFLDEQTI